jgi:hypothetical protein
MPAFDARPVALGGGVVQAEEDALAGGDDAGDAAEQQGGHEAGPPPEGAEEVVALVVLAESGGAGPGGDGAPALGEEESAEQRQQAPGVPGVQRRGELRDPEYNGGRQGPFSHSSAPLLRRPVVQSHRDGGATFRLPDLTVRHVIIRFSWESAVLLVMGVKARGVDSLYPWEGSRLTHFVSTGERVGGFLVGANNPARYPHGTPCKPCSIGLLVRSPYETGLT